jgi:hypothetical protein
MCEYLGYEVKKLKRTRIMSVDLGNLKPGQWRNLTHAEMDEINQAVATSTKTAADSDTQQTQVESKKHSTEKPTSKSKLQRFDNKKATGKRKTLSLKAKKK